MSIIEFFKKHRELLNLTAFERATDIKGGLLKQVSREVDYRHLNEVQKNLLREQLKPLYETLKKIFE